MSGDSASRVLQTPSGWVERRLLLEAVWGLTLVGTLVAVAVSWYIRAVESDLATTSAVVASAYALYGVFRMLVSGLGWDRGGRLGVVTLQLGGVVALAGVYHVAGGLGVPGLLGAFFLPVIACAALRLRLLSIGSALFAFAVVSGFALLASTELRWYAFQLGLPVGFLLDLMPQPGADVVEAPAGGPAWELATLQMFGTLIVLAAVVLGRLAEALLTSLGRLQWSAESGRDARTLSEAALGAATDPTVVVEADLLTILRASHSFEVRMLVTPDQIYGRTLLEVVAFDAPSAVDALISSGSGELDFAVYRVGQERRVARIRVDSLEHGGSRYAVVTFQDRNELSCLASAFDSLEEPIVLVDGDERVLAFNREASRRVESLHFGQSARGLVLPEGRFHLEETKLAHARTPEGLRILRMVEGPLVLALLLSLEAPASPQVIRPDLVEATVLVTDLRPGSEGGGATAYLSQPFSRARLRLQAGLGVQGLGETRWVYGGFALQWRPEPDLLVTGALDAGRGRDGKGSFPYVLGRLSATRRNLGVLDVDAEAVYSDLGEASGNVLRIGASTEVSPGLRAAAAGLANVGGGLETRAVSLRVDRTLGSHGAALFGGVTLGRLTRFSPGVSGSSASRSFFAGSSFPSGRSSLTLSLEVLELPEATRIAALLFARVPLGRRTAP